MSWSNKVWYNNDQRVKNTSEGLRSYHSSVLRTQSSASLDSGFHKAGDRSSDEASHGSWDISGWCFQVAVDLENVV